MNILLAVTGSVAAIRTSELIDQLAHIGEIRVAMTNQVQLFWEPRPNDRVYRDQDEDRPYIRGQEVLHIELRSWADVLVIAPVSANTLGKLAHGLADNLVTNIARAWPRDKPLIIAPAMNTQMWEHPATGEHLATLTRWFGAQLTIVLPIEKRLACGDIGIGAMADIGDIVTSVGRVR